MLGELTVGGALVGQSGVVGFGLEVIRGIYLGLLTGLLPAVIGWSMGFLFKYVTGISIPAFGVVVLAVALAGVNGGLLAVIDPAVQGSANAVTLTTALLVVMMLALYGHGKGDALGAQLPKRVSLRSLRSARISRDVIDFAGGREQVTVRVVGAVEDLPGYPPLPEDLRSEIAAAELQLSATLPVGELESRVESSLLADYELADVVVSLDRQGRATVQAAAPTAPVSRRVTDGRRAVSVETTLPTGLAHRDEVTLHTDRGPVSGTVVSARTDGASQTTPSAESTERRGVTAGGPGRLTVAIERSNLESVLGAEAVGTVTAARGAGREYDLLSAIRRGGGQVIRLRLDDASRLAGRSVRTVEREEGVVVAARRRNGTWAFDVPDETLTVGDELFLVGERGRTMRER